MRLSWRESVAGTTPANWLGTQRTGERILPMFIAHATPAHIFYCAGRGMARSRLGGAADGAGSAEGEVDAAVAVPARSK